MPLYGHELGETMDPLAANLGWAVDLTKEFVGVEKLREVLLGGAASSWMLQNLGPLILAKDDRAGFRIDLQLKDLRLANELAFELGVPLPGTALATNLYLEARAHGEGSNGNQAMFRVYDRMTSQQQESAKGAKQ